MEIGNIISKLNQHVLDRISDYQNLNIYDKKVSTPYFINNIEFFIRKLHEKCEIPEHLASDFHRRYKNKEISFGWYRGKGTPEDLVDATMKISKNVGLNLEEATAEGIQEFMKLFGIGIDCSGFVYNILVYAFGELNMFEKFNQSLNWLDRDKMDVCHAGVFVFAGTSSNIVEVKNIRPLDIILIKSNGSYKHIILIVEKGNKLYGAQSNLSGVSEAINLSRITIKENEIDFDYKFLTPKSWKEYSKKNTVEIRRLRILQ